MSAVIAGHEDQTVTRFKEALDDFERRYPGAEAVLFRDTPGVIKIRILDTRFEGQRRLVRHQLVWDFLTERVGDDMQHLYVLLLLTPQEADASMANFEFEHPVDAEDV